MQSYEINDTDIAIIGMSGRFPGSNTIAEFWHNLCEGIENITPFSEEQMRSALLKSLGSIPEERLQQLLHNPNYVRSGAALAHIDLFAADFFGYTAAEAELLDPQQRFFLECCWEALEHAGYNPENNKEPVGVYAGAEMSSYHHNLQSCLGPEERDLMTLIGNSCDYLTSRISYKLNLKGPSYGVQSACSTSLMAIHIACQGLKAGECDMALAGGVVIYPTQEMGYVYQEGAMVSPDGHCRPFDAHAQGTVLAHGGVGVLVLKRLADAMEDGNSIYAVIKGSATNNDGIQKNGYTSPGINGQARAISEALLVSGVAPETIGYVEAHGTATPLGDSIEFAALTRAFRHTTQKKQFCALGSVKSNLGHLGAASGVAAVMKTALALHNKQIPATLHYEQPNPHIDFVNSPFYINQQLLEWPSEEPRRAAVNSIAIGGSNVHIILEEAPTFEPAAQEPELPQILLLSARTPAALEVATANLAHHLTHHPAQPLADVAYTLQVGRKLFAYRRMLVCQNTQEAIEILETQDAQRLFSHHLDGDPLASSTISADSYIASRTALTTLGQRWLKGEIIDWKQLHQGATRRRVPLPTYPFERQRYWIYPQHKEHILPTQTIVPHSVSQSKRSLDQWFYLPSWQRSLVPSQNGRTTLTNWLVFCASSDPGSSLARRLEQQGQTVVTVIIGKHFTQYDEHTYAIDPQKPEDYDTLLNILHTHNHFPERIVHGWGITSSPQCSDPDTLLSIKSLEAAQNVGFYSLIYLAQALGKQGDTSQQALWVITNNMQEIAGDELRSPEKATILGPCHVIAEEYPHIRCCCVDISVPPSKDWRMQRLIEQLLTECRSELVDTLVAYRGDHRYVQVFEQIAVPKSAHPTPRLRAQGTYLITGGLGGIALTLADLLARSVQARLVLLDTMPFPEREQWPSWLQRHGEQEVVSQKILQIKAMEMAGAEVFILQADVSNPTQLHDAIERCRERFGMPSGVLHAAAQTSGGIIQSKSRATTEQHFAPLLKGTLLLGEMFRKTPLDFFVLCSSIRSIIGGVGQVDDCAANAFLDAFAPYYRALTGTFTLALNWDAWKEVGMAAKMEVHQAFQSAHDKRIAQGILQAEGCEVFIRALNCGMPQLIISTLDFQISSTPALQTIDTPDPAQLERTRLPRPRLSVTYAPPSNEIEQTLVAIWQELFGIDKVGVNDHFYELGGHSLLAIKLATRVNRMFPVEISLARVIEAHTIATLAEVVEALMIEKITTLSDEEVERLLA